MVSVINKEEVYELCMIKVCVNAYEKGTFKESTSNNHKACCEMKS